MAQGALKAVRSGSKRHIELINAGYRTHHTDGQIVYMARESRSKDAVKRPVK